METPDPLARLPEAYRRALTLHRDGADEATIATELEIPREAVEPLLRIAEAELTRACAAARAPVDPD